ncbi:Hypothetical predicted protein [Olea europaea subsp. europaea]|uniref:Uncharacterized protein n=1 Tax=Olea europaea subsp. europaea TaxID=158383 RepID=A0A8S0SSV5_OLEEU|nr:Hypothetical predicted protein [Olea europaea subsp. europaea]
MICPEASLIADSSSRKLDTEVEGEAGEENNNAEINHGQSGGQVANGIQQAEYEVEHIENEVNIDEQTATQSTGHHTVTRSKAGIFKPKIYTSQKVDK